MRKLIFPLLLLALTCIGWGPMMLSTKPSSTPCVAAGCTGTYAACWTGEYTGDTDKMCLNSGASTQDALGDTGTTIHTDGAINGFYGAYLDHGDDNVWWATPSATLDEAGTIRLLITSPDPVNNVNVWWAAYSDTETARNHIQLGINGAVDLFEKHEGNAVDLNTQEANEPGASTTFTVCATWDTTADSHCVGWVAGDSTCAAVFAGSDYGCDSENLSPFSADGQNTDIVMIGNGCDVAGGDDDCDVDDLVNTAWKIDDMIITTTYVGD